MDKRTLDQRIAQQFPALTPKLQLAARYVLDHPRDVAMQSMRALGQQAGVQAGVMLRLARELGFDNYEDFRTVYKSWLGQGANTLSARASALQQRDVQNADARLMADMLQSETQNLTQTLASESAERFAAAQKLLAQARHIYVVGLRSLFPAAYYFSYACGMFRQDTTLLTSTGGVFTDALRKVGADDAMVVFSAAPYARDTVAAVEFAHERGARIVAVTDSTVSPIAGPAHALLLFANASPSLFPSVVPALSVAQTLAAMMVQSGGQASLDEIDNSEAQLRRFDVYARTGKS